MRGLEVTVVVRDLKAAECSMNQFLEGLKEEFGREGGREGGKEEEGKGMMGNGVGVSSSAPPVLGGGRGGMHVVGGGGAVGGGNSVL